MEGHGSAGSGRAWLGKAMQGEVDSKHPAISVVGWNGGNSDRAWLGVAMYGVARPGAARICKARQSFNKEA